MIDILIIVIALISFLDAIFEKIGMWEMLQKAAADQESKFLYKLSSCRFCIKFHMSVIMVVTIGFVDGFNLNLVTIPFLASGLMYLFDKQ